MAISPLTTVAQSAKPTGSHSGTIHVEGWSFVRSELDWYPGSHPEEQRKAGTLDQVGGWTEYAVTIPKAGWYELWLKGVAAEGARDFWLDGKPLLWLTTSDGERDAEPGKTGWFKEANFYFTAGAHTLRFRRLIYPAQLPSAFELRPAENRAESSVRIVDAGKNAVRAGERLRMTVEGGTAEATTYELVAQDRVDGSITRVGEVAFPAMAAPVRKTVDVVFPRQGAFRLLGRVAGRLLRPADLKGGTIVAIDTKNPPAPAAELKTTSVLDIDCTATPPKEGFWEKDGPTRVVDSPLGRYRESSGRGSNAEWGTDGFSYRFDLPDTDHLYRLTVDYPDNDRRTMGFWINDGPAVQANHLGVVNTGGVETGDHYPLSGKMATHQAFFYPRNNKDVVIAVFSLVPGTKAAAARIRIDRVDSPLPAAPLGKSGGRSMGFYFEENGRWLRFFGGTSRDPEVQVKTMERWAQWNRSLGANLMYPTVNAYQGNHFPSHILDGYFSTPLNETRLVALVAEKYQQQFIPEIFLTGQKLFDWRVMGIQVVDERVNGRTVQNLQLPLSAAAADYVLRDRDGGYRFSSEPFVYNALNPRVEEMYISVFGELADLLKDCDSFAGISSRLMLSWQHQGWNALPGINWGYDDWTVSAFEHDTGLKVPGAANDPGRFRQRYEFLTGPQRERWIQWRCERLHAFHLRLLARIRQAKPSAKLYFTYHRPYASDVSTNDVVGQLRDLGIDCSLYANEPGVVFVPVALYGRRFSTPVHDADAAEPMFDERFKEVARLGGRGYGMGSVYFEVNRNLDWRKFGGRPNAAFDACTPSGVNERELFALALADSDSSVMENGGNGWFFGTPAVLQPFLREYRALPAVAFDRVAGAVDPVAVWQHVDRDGALWFYAVNRLPVAVTAHLSLAGTSEVRSAAGGDVLSLRDGALSVALEPFMLRSFRATGGGAGGKVTGCRVDTPQDFIASIEPQIASARELRDALEARRVIPEATAQDVALATKDLTEAIDAFRGGRYWKAHSQLERLAVAQVQYASGRYLDGVLQRSVPAGVPNFSETPPKGMRVVLSNEPEDVGPVLDLAYDDSGALWMSSNGRVAEFGADGKWKRNVSLFQPYEFDDGDNRRPTLAPRYAFNAAVLRVAANGRVIAQEGTDAPVAFAMKQGRAERLRLGSSYAVSGESRLLAVDAKGHALISRSEGSEQGVYDYSPDGTLNARVTAFAAEAGDVDSAGRLYLAAADGVHVLDAARREIALVAEKNVHHLAAARDGSAIYLVVGDGRTLAAFRRSEKSGDVYALAWRETLPGRATALARGHGQGQSTTLAIAFATEANAASVQEFSVSGGLRKIRDIVSAPVATNVRLSGEFASLKICEGTLYLRDSDGLLRVRPAGRDTSEQASRVVLPDLKFDAFAFGPEGDLYLAVNTLDNSAAPAVYRCRKKGESWGSAERLETNLLFPETSERVIDFAVQRDGKLVAFLSGAAGAKSPNYTPRALRVVRGAPGEARQTLLEFEQPAEWPVVGSVTAQPDGSLLIAGGSGRGIWRFDANGHETWAATRAKSCPPGYVDLRCPTSAAATRNGEVWSVDPTRDQLLRFDANGKFQAALGSFGEDSSSERLALNQPSSVAVLADADGREWVFVADAGNRRLLKFPVQP
ncbi:MAG TPA: hypothetical protein VFT72_04560 [Opitutaceae bacterium]|nr:hypothetical protein [Opitutaceae bacterium]